MEKDSVLKTIISLWKIIPSDSKLKMSFLLILMFVNGFAEILTVGSVVPFIAAITNPEIILNNSLLTSLLSFFDINDKESLVVFMCILFGSAVIFSACLRLIISKLNYKWCYELTAELGILVFEKTLKQDYLSHSSRNSSEIISGVSIKTGNLLGALILPVMNSIQLIILVVSIFLTLLFILPLSNIFLLSSFAFLYFFISLFMKRSLNINSKIIASHQINAIKVLQESLNNIKEVILGDFHGFYKKRFATSEKAYRNGLGRNAFLSIAPRYAVEALGIVIIIVIAMYTYYKSNKPEDILPAIGLIALSSQRMLPYLQQLYAAYSGIVGNQQSNIDALSLINQKTENKEDSKKIFFNESIKLENVSFSYNGERKFLLKNINLEIKKGEFVGIIGSTGSGKSTLVDIIMGLIPPDDGKIFVDGEELNRNHFFSWRKNFVHVSQNIFIADTTIKKNITLGISDELVDKDKVKMVSKLSVLDELISGSPRKFDTNVGESGSQLSGGQKQRIAIARALYRDGNIIVLDEATNSLDFKTEEKIFSNFKTLKNKTIISIIHNIQKIDSFDRIIILDKGKIVFNDISKNVTNNQIFKNLSKKIAN
tara:strand:+ start:450 stop:2243 length:1794 start_codon:yes stop_codon:yes gene_type:complete